MVYGQGIGLLKLESPLTQRIADALGQCVQVVAWENTMTTQQITRSDMLPNIGYVPGGRRRTDAEAAARVGLHPPI